MIDNERLDGATLFDYTPILFQYSTWFSRVLLAMHAEAQVCVCCLCRERKLDLCSLRSKVKKQTWFLNDG